MKRDGLVESLLSERSKNMRGTNLDCEVKWGHVLAVSDARVNCRVTQQLENTCSVSRDDGFMQWGRANSIFVVDNAILITQENFHHPVMTTSGGKMQGSVAAIVHNIDHSHVLLQQKANHIPVAPLRRKMQRRALILSML